MKEFVCEICKSVFKQYACQRKSKHVFCTRKCYAKYKSSLMKGKLPKNISQIAGWNRGKKLPQISGSNHPNWKGGKYKTKIGYIMIYAPSSINSNKFGYMYEHRYVMEIILKRPLKEHEIVHHMNGIKNDNSPENLQLVASQAKHNSFHPRQKDSLHRFI